jgi:uncharacterized repeat protein (TIGR01451 family)
VSTLPGGIVLYQITYSNIGTADSDTAVLTEALPTNATFNSAFSDPRWDTEGGGMFTLTIGNLPVGASGTVFFAVNVNDPLPAGVTEISNTVSIADGGDSGPDLNPNDNTDTDTTPIVIQPEAALQITKTDNETIITPGSPVTYTIMVTNAGQNDVTGATFTDNVPTSLTGVTFSSVVSGGATTTVPSGTGNDISASLDVPVGGTVVYTVTGTLDPKAAAGTLTNVASVVPPADITDPNTSNNFAMDQNTIVPVSDLGVEKTSTFTDLDGSGTLTPGDEIVFAVAVTNHGPSTAQSVSVTDLLPNGYQFVSDDARLNGGTYQAGTGLWTIGTLGDQQTAVLHITAIVGPGGNYTNIATINPNANEDPDPTNNSASDTPTVEPSSDLSLSKTMALTNDINGTRVISIGDQVTFTITLNNLGPNAADGVHIQDLLPAGYSFVSATSSEGTYTSATGDWNVGTVNVLSPETLSIVATVVADQPDSGYTNSAQVSATDSFDPNPANDQTSVKPFIADLSLTKTAALAPGGDLDNSGTLTLGDLVNFTVNVTNAGPDFATGVQVSDPLAAGFTWVSDNSGGTYDPISGLWNVGVMAPGTTETLTITVSVNDTGPFTNTAQVTASDQFDPNSTPDNNVPTEDDQATVTLTPGSTLPPQVDLAITKDNGKTTAVPGTSDTYTIVVSNTGPSAVAGASVSDLLPDGVTSATWSATASSGGGTVIGPADGAGDLATTVNLPVNASVTFRFTVQVDPSATGTLVNTATVAPPDGVTDPTPGNDNAIDTDALTPQADLSITKTDGIDAAIPGGSTRYTIVVSNTGSSTAVDQLVEDRFPPEITAASWTAVASPGSSVAATSGTGDIVTTVTVLPGGTFTFTAVAPDRPRRHRPPGQHRHGGHPSGGQHPRRQQRHRHRQPDAPDGPDHHQGRRHDHSGSGHQHHLHHHRQQRRPQRRHQRQPVRPPADRHHQRYLGVRRRHGRRQLQRAGDRHRRPGNHHQPAGRRHRHLPLHGPDRPDGHRHPGQHRHGHAAGGTPVSDTDSDTLTPQADLTVTKDDGKLSVVPGTPNTYTITVSNGGPNTVSSVILTDEVPAALLNPVFGTPSAGSYDPDTGVWSGLSLATGQSVTMTLTGTIDPAATGSLTNSVTVVPPDGVTDPNPGDNTDTDTDTLTPQADLAIIKTDGVTSVVPGGSTTYTIVVSNAAGPSAVTGARVFDSLSAGATSGTWAFDSATGGGAVTGPSGGSGGLAATVDLPVGATITFTFTVDVSPSAAGTLVNTATVTPPAGTTDPNTDNNSATDSDTLTPEADLSITKTDGKSSAVPGTFNT